MTNFALIFICMAAGIIFTRLRALPEDAHVGVNAWIIYIALPAMTLRYVPGIEWSARMVLPGLAPLLIWGGGWVFSTWLARKKNLDHKTRTALWIGIGLGNTSFLGFPLITAYFGEEYITYAILFDQVGFMICSTLVVMAALKVTHGQEQAAQSQSARAGGDARARIGFKPVLRKIFAFPPFLACVAGLVLPLFMDLQPAYPLLDKLAATLSPLAIFSIGLQIRLDGIEELAPLIRHGLAYKLILAPLLTLLLALALGAAPGKGDPLAGISVFEASMGPHITASLLATQYKLAPRLSSLLVGAGILASFCTSALWYWVVKGLFWQ